MSQSLPPNDESAQQTATLAEKVRRNQKLLIILSTFVIVAIGVWLLVVFIRPEIKTWAGTLVITKAHFTDRVPPGCNSFGPRCYVAKPGYRILIIWMEPKNGIGKLTLDTALAEGMYIVAEDGTQPKLINQTMEISPPLVTSISRAFEVKDSERNFKVVWSDHPAVDLNPLLYFIP